MKEEERIFASIRVNGFTATKNLVFYEVGHRVMARAFRMRTYHSFCLNLIVILKSVLHPLGASNPRPLDPLLSLQVQRAIN